MNGLMPDSKKYNESLSKTPGPIMPNQLPKVKMDLAGLSRYQKKTGKSLSEMSDKEKNRFLSERDYTWLDKI